MENKIVKKIGRKIMRKDSLMCFRLSKNMHDSLAKLAREEKRSLSSLIEIVLTNYLKEKKALKAIKQEKRQYPRKTVSVPAFVNQLAEFAYAVYYAERHDIAFVDNLAQPAFKQGPSVLPEPI